MENNLSKILLVAVIIMLVAVISLGVILYVQSKKVDKITETFLPSSASSEGNQAASVAQPGSASPDFYIQDAKKNFSENVRQISGTVTEVNGNTLMVEAEIVDVNGLAAENIEQKNIPTVERSYAITTDEKTEFVRKKMQAIKTGDAILVEAKELVYQTDRLTAVKIICPIENKATDEKAAQ